MKDRIDKGRTVNIHIKLQEEIVLLFYCISYILAIVYVLKPDLMSAELVVTSYHKTFSLYKTIISIIVVFVVKYITYCFVNKGGTFSYYIIRVLFFIYEIPAILSLGLFYFENYFTFWICEIIYWILLCSFIGFWERKRIQGYKVETNARKQRMIRAIILFLAVIGLIYSFRTIGNLNISLSLAGIYRIRAAFKENTNEMITFFKTALGGYLCPGFIVYYFSKRKYKFVALMTVLQGFFYFMARDKTYLFLIPIAYIIGLLGNNLIKDFAKWLRRGYLLYSIGLLVTITGTLRDMIFEIITRRIQVMPVFFNYIYYDYFSSHTPIWWRQDTFLIDKLFSVVYPRSVPLQISHIYFNDIEGNPNAGMFAEAISRCGYAGIIIYPILLGTVICLVNSFYRNVNKEIKLMLAVCFAMSVSNDVITSTSFVMVLLLILLGSKFFKQTGKNMIGITSLEEYV